MLQQRTGATVGSVIRRQLPARLGEGLLVEAGLEPVLPISQLPRDARLRLVDLLVRYELPWTGDEGYRKAEVTGGGVTLSDSSYAERCSTRSDRLADTTLPGPGQPARQREWQRQGCENNKRLPRRAAAQLSKSCRINSPRR